MRWTLVLLLLAACPGAKSSQATTREARNNLRRLADASRMYYAQDRVNQATGVALPRQFPGPATDFVPPLGSCCKQPGQRCAPDPALFAGEPWKSLLFSPEEPFRYSYRYVADDKGFTITASGDLDCDGVASTYELRGSGEPVREDAITATQPLE